MKVQLSAEFSLMDGAAEATGAGGVADAYGMEFDGVPEQHDAPQTV